MRLPSNEDQHEKYMQRVEYLLRKWKKEDDQKFQEQRERMRQLLIQEGLIE